MAPRNVNCLSEPRQPLTRAGLKTILVPYAWLLVKAVALFWAAGHVRLPRAWIYFTMSFAASTAGALILWRGVPELANQRSRVKEGTKPWDVVILGLHFLLMLLVTPAVAGLDASRFHWSTLGPAFVVPGAVLYVAASSLQHRVLVNGGEPLLRKHGPNPERPGPPGDNRRTVQDRKAPGLRRHNPRRPPCAAYHRLCVCPGSGGDGRPPRRHSYVLGRRDAAGRA